MDPKELIADRTVLVTGAAGSIGSELSRQIATLAPKALLLLDQAETPLFDLCNEIPGAIPLLCDVRRRSSLGPVWRRHAPNIVFHAAAYKHVPMLETHAQEAIRTNIVGTMISANVSAEYGTERFVFLSTDKAVHPVSVMGASKRAAEVYLQALDTQAETIFCTVRFGNVLGSQGSVVPTFQRQIAKGGPVTVTHPDMTRYFMTIPQAVELVLAAGAMAQGGEVFLLNMGEPIRIADLAKLMIGLSGRHIAIEYTGIRPGEKLHEELNAADEQFEPTAHPGILACRTEVPDWEEVAKRMRHYDEGCGDLRLLVPEYKQPEGATDGQTSSIE